MKREQKLRTAIYSACTIASLLAVPMISAFGSVDALDVKMDQAASEQLIAHTQSPLILPAAE